MRAGDFRDQLGSPFRGEILMPIFQSASLIDVHHAHGPWQAHYSMMRKRSDRLTATHVDLAINLAAIRGVAAGARALVEQGVPIEVAHRVLLQPGLRRRVPRSTESAYRPVHRQSAPG